MRYVSEKVSDVCERRPHRTRDGRHMADITRRFGWRHLRSAPTAHIRHHKRGTLVARRPRAELLVPRADRRALRGPGRRPRAGDGVPRPYGGLPGRDRAGDGDLPDQRPGHGRRPARLLRRPGHRASGAARRWSRSRRCSPRRRSSTRWTSWRVRRWRPRWWTGSARYGSGSPTGSPPSRGCRPPASRSSPCASSRIRPEAEVERALRTPARGADPAGGRPGRRTSAGRSPSSASATIAENELASKIELARREEQLVDQRGTQRPPRGRGEVGGRRRYGPRRRPRRAVRLAEAEAARTRCRRGARRGAGGLAAGARGGRSWHAARPGGDPAGREPAAHRQPHPLPRRADRPARQARAGAEREREPGPARGAGAPHDRVRGAAGPARHARPGRVRAGRARGRSIDEVAERHRRNARAPSPRWPRRCPLTLAQTRVERADLDRFLFGARGRGRRGRAGRAGGERREVPVRPAGGGHRHRPGPQSRASWCATGRGTRRRLLPRGCSPGGTGCDALTMAEAVADDTQRLVALNEIYLGPPGHQTARYRLGLDGARRSAVEAQASSGRPGRHGHRRDRLVALALAGAGRRPAAARPHPIPGCSGSCARPGPHRPPARRWSRASWRRDGSQAHRRVGSHGGVRRRYGVRRAGADVGSDGAARDVRRAAAAGDLTI